MSELQDISNKFEIAKEFSDDEKSLKQKLINLKEQYTKAQDVEKNNIQYSNDEVFIYIKKIPDDIIELKLQIIKQFMVFPINTMLFKEYHYIDGINDDVIAKSLEKLNIPTDIYDKSLITRYNGNMAINLSKCLINLNLKKIKYNTLISSLINILFIIYSKNVFIKTRLKYKYMIKDSKEYYDQDLYKLIQYYDKQPTSNYCIENQDNLVTHLQQCKDVKESIIDLIKMLNSYYSNINDTNFV